MAFSLHTSQPERKEPPITTPPPVAQALAALNVPHRVFSHPGPVRSLEQAAQERGQHPDQVIRSLLFRLADDDFILLLVAGPRQVPWKNLRQYLGVSRVTTATHDDVLAITGYPPGAVGPFGLRQPVRLLLDRCALAHDEISIGSGVRGVTIILTATDLRHALELAHPGRIEPVSLYDND